MLKSYKDLSRWYDALEPDNGAPAPAQQDDASLDPVEDDGPARYPHYIREEEDPEEARARNEVPADLASRRAEFTGGWSDWVAVHAPGPDDDYAPRDGDLVRFPWPEDDDYDDEPAPLVRPHPRSLRDHPASRRGRVVLVLIVAVLLLAFVAVGALYLLRSSGNRAAVAPTTPPMQFTAGSAQAGITSGCPTERAERLIRSAEAGGTHSGPDVVLAFQYAYYVERSGERARAFVAPDAAVPAAPTISAWNRHRPGGHHALRARRDGGRRHVFGGGHRVPAGRSARHVQQADGHHRGDRRPHPDHGYRGRMKES